MHESYRCVQPVEVAHDLVECVPAWHRPERKATRFRPESSDAVTEQVEGQAVVPVATLREEGGHVAASRTRDEVEVLAVIEAVAALQRLEQGLVAARRVDPGRQTERLLEVVGFAGGEDALPFADLLQARLG